MTAIHWQREEPEIVYPESDGRPMGETEFHRDEAYDLIHALQRYFERAADVHVTGNLFLYFVEDDPGSVVCPDVCVIQGVPKRERRIYKLWEEDGRTPCLVIELTSKTTRREDLGRKKILYERLGVEEYFLHDPFGEYLLPRLQGFRLGEDGRYRPIEAAADGSLASLTTGLSLRREGRKIRLVETATGKLLLWDQERDARADQAEALEEQVRRAEERANQEAAARRAAEEELALLRRELERRG